MEDKDYKKLYEEAIAKARKAVADGMVSQKFVECIFHELAESEDERIRKFLHHKFTAQYLCKDKLGKWHGEPVTNILAWLEKQGDDIKKIKELENKIESLQKCFKIANDEIADKSQELYALKCKIEDEGYQCDEKKNQNSRLVIGL